MRVISDDFRKEFYAPSTASTIISLLKVSHADLAEDLFLCNNNTDITSNGQLYTALGFNVNLPSDTEEGVPRVTLQIDNVDRQIVEVVRTVQTPLTIELALILSESPDVIEMGWFEFILRNIRYNRMTVEGELWYEDVANDRFPKDFYVPSLFPGMF